MSNTFWKFSCAILLVACIWIWLKACNSNPQPVVDNKYKDTLQWYRDSLEVTRAHESVLMETVDAAESHIVELEDKSDAAETKLAKANKEVNYWIKRVIPFTESPGKINASDTAMGYCDSLANAAIDAQLRCNEVIQIKDSTILWYQGEVGSYKIITQSLIHDTVLYAGQVKTLENKVGQLQKSAQPKRKLYLGVEAGSTQLAFQYIQVGGIYMDVKGNGWKMGGGLQLSGQPIFNLGYYHLLSFKKK